MTHKSSGRVGTRGTFCCSPWFLWLPTPRKHPFQRCRKVSHSFILHLTAPITRSKAMIRFRDLFRLINGGWQVLKRGKYLCLHAGTNRIQAPITGVIVVQVNFAKPKARMALTATVEKTMMNCHTNDTVFDMVGIRSDQHGLIVLQEMAPAAPSKRYAGSPRRCLQLINVLRHKVTAIFGENCRENSGAVYWLQLQNWHGLWKAGNLRKKIATLWTASQTNCLHFERKT